MKRYLATTQSEPIMRARLGEDIDLQTADYGKELSLNGVKVSLHPAGHIPGSAQVRVEHEGQVWVVTGDCKTEADATSEPFELIPCHGLVIETTFGLPIYQWQPEAEVFAEINDWWRSNAAADKASVLYGYALGKAQRLQAGVDASIGPIVVHGAVANMNRACESAGVKLPKWKMVSELPKEFDYSQALIVAVPSANGTPWLRRFKDQSSGFASGWMAIRGTRRRRAVDRGFVLSDHLDWPALLDVVKESGAETVWTTHGYADPTARYFREEMGLDAVPLRTEFVGEVEDPE